MASVCAVSKNLEAQSTVSTYSGLPSPAPDLDYHIVISGDSSCLSIQLPDESQVVLDYETSLWFPTCKQGEPNDLWVNGHISFTVSSKRDKAFRIHCAYYDLIVDPGSELDIESIPWNPPTPKEKYVLSSFNFLKGSFRLVTPTIDRKFVAPTSVDILGNDSVVTDTSIDWPTTTRWRTDKTSWHFDRVSLRTAIASVNRWYHVNITYDYADENKKLYAILPKSLSLTDMLNTIKDSWFDGKSIYKVRKSEIYFHHRD